MKNIKNVERIFWDDWGYMSAPFDLYILYNDGTYENYKVNIYNSGSFDQKENRKEFTKFRKYARIDTLGIRTREDLTVTEWLDKKVIEFRNKQEEE